MKFTWLTFKNTRPSRGARQHLFAFGRNNVAACNLIQFKEGAFEANPEKPYCVMCRNVCNTLETYFPEHVEF